MVPRNILHIALAFHIDNIVRPANKLLDRLRAPAGCPQRLW